MRSFKRLCVMLTALIGALALLLSLAPAALAEEETDPRFEGKSWEEVMEDFFEEHGTTREKVACGWMNTVTGEAHYHNGDQYMVSGSMYKVPMNMIFLDRIHNGELSWDSFVGGYRYEYALHATIVESNNEVAKSMWDYLGGYQPYRHLLAPYMGEDPDTVDEKFYENNFSTPRQMIYSLNLLCTEPERFPRLAEAMLEAEPSKYFNAHEHSVDVAHKYGYYTEGAHFYLNDCAICYTTEPMCIVMFTDTVTEPYALLADYCDLMIDYTEYTTVRRLEEERRAAEEAAIAALNASEGETGVEASGTDASTVTAQTGAQTVSPAPTAAPARDDEAGTSLFLPLVLIAAVGVGALAFVGASVSKAGRGKLKLPWAIAAVVLSVAALAMCILAPYTRQKSSAPAAEERDLGEARQSAELFFSSVVSGDLDTAYSRLSGYESLGLEKRPSDPDSAAVWDALRQSWSYSLYGDCAATGSGARQQVVFTSLDLAALSAAVDEETDRAVERLASTLSQDEIYDEEGGYLPSFTDRAYSEALAAVLEHAEDYYLARGLNVELEQVSGEWLIVPDDALFAALTGGAVN